MPLTTGSRLGPYEILSALGAGGMGEVYRARDTRLKREVALKVLSEEFSKDSDRLARFQREAELLATLNHPNVAAVYGLEQADGVTGIVLELVEGETLADQIARGPLTLSDALPIARQIAEALEAAHERGVIHRDLKPANIKVTPEGKVKVLDFGLAKMLDTVRAEGSGQRADANFSMSPTLSMHATYAGVILGTAAYMSPEQARGKPVDRRTDTWAFGCVLFEMLTGKRMFATGETMSDAVAAILKNDPDWRELPADTPAHIRTLLRRCLQKDPQQRLPHMGVARLEIDDAIAAPAFPTVQTGVDVRATSRWTRAVPWAFAAILGVALLVLVALPRRDTSSSRPVTRLELNLPSGVELYTLGGSTVAVSPDGTRVAFIGLLGGLRQVYVRALDRFEAVPLRGTDTAMECFFSADGRSIGFLTPSAGLRKVALADGLVVTLAANVDFNGARWGDDDRIVFARSGTLWQVPSSGGAPKQLLTLDAGRQERAQAWPTVLPGSKAILFSSIAGTALDSRIESLEPATGARRVVIERGTFPQYLPNGQLLFYRDGDLLAAPFDLARLSVTGSPTRVFENLPEASTGTPLAEVSATGTLVYAPTTATARLVWVSRQGAEQPLVDALRNYANPRIAPDGNRVLIQAGDLWIQDATRSTFSRLTSGEAIAGGGFPVWTPDGGRVIFRTTTGLRWQATDGSGRGDVMAGTTSADYPGSISSDGERLLFVRISPDTSGDIYIASLRGDPQITAILKTPAYEGSARLSPDGRWIAYSSNESGQMEVYLRSFTGPDRRSQVSAQGGVQPVWNPNGKELFYRNGNKMMVVALAAAPELTLSQPQLLFEQRYAFGSGITIANYDVSADGRRFVMVKDESSSSRLNVVLNWTEELKRIVPSR